LLNLIGTGVGFVIATLFVSEDLVG
jgi:hypothetical protein